MLRHLLSANLPQMFPENSWWIREHSTGAEANVHYIDTAGLRRNGFIDSLVGMTAIEYERNLTVRAIYTEGYHQVEEYCSALLNQGIAKTISSEYYQIPFIGLLSVSKSHGNLWRVWITVQIT